MSAAVIDIETIWESAKRGERVAPPDDDMPVDVYDEMAGNVPQPKPEKQAEPKPATGKRPLTTMREAMTCAIKAMQERAQRGDALAGLSTGYEQLDRRLDGLKRGCLYALGARPGMGKSAMALNVALNVATSGVGVLYISLEMTTNEHAMRALFCRSGVPSYRLKRGTLLPCHWESLTNAVRDMIPLPILWDDATGQTVEDIAEKVDRAIRRAEKNGKTIGLVVIDHALLIRGTNQKQDRRNQLVHITQSLKNLAKERGVAVLALAQLSRALEARNVKSKRPQMSDLKESGSWEEDADAVMLLYREGYYEKTGSSTMEVIVPKIREGEAGTVKLAFEGDCYRIVQMDPRDERAEEDDGGS